MEVSGFWKCVAAALILLARVEVGEGMLQCSLGCPNQTISCNVSGRNEPFLLPSHTGYGQHVNLEPTIMGIPDATSELAVTGCQFVTVMSQAFKRNYMIRKLNFSNIDTLTFQEDSLVFTTDLTLTINQVSKLTLSHRALVFNPVQQVAEQHLRVTNTQLFSFSPDAIIVNSTTKHLTISGENNTLAPDGDFSDSHCLPVEFSKLFSEIAVCSSSRIMASFAVFAAAFLCRKGFEL
ncbi:uncharacterized protein LOC122248244 [Penaeus japonicus]|uniref:uncharacterized protein LOC122248244 n=1 Tax=Penaeus japonicus TaxID=27405 RepID=UPI001C7163A7|nr:uncharacterized protein LOC122248244 [Penaeus japonicus]